MLSVADVYADIVGGFTDHLDRRYLGELNVEHWSVGMDRAVKFRDGGADDRFYDIDFRAMQADPIGEVRAALRVARRAGHRRVRGADAAAGGRRTRENREPHTHADPADVRAGPRARSGRCSPTTSTHAQRWTTHER